MIEQAIQLFETKEYKKSRRNDRCITVSETKCNLRTKDNAAPARLKGIIYASCRKLRCACIRLSTSHACGVGFLDRIWEH
jgi:hypothetical protein